MREFNRVGRRIDSIGAEIRLEISSHRIWAHVVLTSVAGFLFAVSATDLSVLFFLFTIVYGVW